MDYFYQNQELEVYYTESGTKDCNPVYDTYEINSIEVYRNGVDITDIVERLNSMQSRKINAWTIFDDIYETIETR